MNWLRRFSPNLTDDKILARVVDKILQDNPSAFYSL